MDTPIVSRMDSVPTKPTIKFWHLGLHGKELTFLSLLVMCAKDTKTLPTLGKINFM